MGILFQAYDGVYQDRTLSLLFTESHSNSALDKSIGIPRTVDGSQRYSSLSRLSKKETRYSISFCRRKTAYETRLTLLEEPLNTNLGMYVKRGKSQSEALVYWVLLD